MLKKEDVMSILTSFWERKHGKGRFNVDFVKVKGLKTNFSDQDEIKEYISVICFTEKLCKMRWFLTEKNILVCGHIPGLDTIPVSIDVDNNIPFLLSQDKKEIQEGFVVPSIIVIEGLDLPKGTVVGPRPGFWVVFLGLPK